MIGETTKAQMPNCVHFIKIIVKTTVIRDETINVVVYGNLLYEEINEQNKP